MQYNPTIEFFNPNGYTKRYIVRFLTLDRVIEKTFCTSANISEAVVKGQQFGLVGNKLLLAEDGCEICDDEAFLYYIQHNAKFMLAYKSSQWVPTESPVNDTSSMLA